MVKGDSLGVIAQLAEQGTPEAMERAHHFAMQGGAEGYFSECADLALYLIQHSETPNRFVSIEEFAVPGRMKLMGDLTFPSSSPHDFYQIVGDFYATQRPLRGITPEKVADFMKIHRYYFHQEGDKLRISDVDNLTGMLANCL